MRNALDSREMAVSSEVSSLSHQKSRASADARSATGSELFSGVENSREDGGAPAGAHVSRGMVFAWRTESRVQAWYSVPTENRGTKARCGVACSSRRIGPPRSAISARVARTTRSSATSAGTP